MAKILPCYSLCPLIEQKSFLGLTEDAETDTVLVTANSNIIGRYRISDSKQISSWNSKGSITCAAVYDKSTEMYTGVFNHNEVRLWSIADESIDKVKKYKFSDEICGIVTSPESGRAIIVFSNGHVSYVDVALEKRKTGYETSHLSENEKIESFEIAVYANLIIVSLLLSCDGSRRIIGVVPDDQNLVFNYCFSMNGVLLGNSLLVDKNLDSVSIWSDGKLYRHNLHGGKRDTKLLHTFQNINSNHLVTVKTLSPYSVAICYVKNGGLMLQVYSIKYSLIQCKQFYEDCINASELWNYETKLFLIMGHNLVVVPYIQENQKLSTLIGSNIDNLGDEKEDVLPEAEICSRKVPQLLENNDISEITNLINSFRDVPDSVIIEILLWCFKKKKSRKTVLETILLKYAVNDVFALRNAFSVDISLELLEYVISNIPQYDDNVKLMKWASMLIDAFYQQYMTSGDKSILDKLSFLLSTLKNEYSRLNDFREIASTASCIKRKKVILSK